MMMLQKIRSVIVEDETAAREVLKNYVQKYCPQIEIIGEAQNFKEAVPLLHELKPQLVFLDVEMPFGNAFDVLEACKDLQFETIFVTAFSEYSLKALNQSAAYYLLKPISIEELITAVNKVQQHLLNHEIFNRNRIIVENFRETKPEKQQVILPTLEGFEVVKMEEIVRLRGNGNFTDLYLADGQKKNGLPVFKAFY
jgi:two-component system LytT family response regulator